jgi:beta-glucosidase-like glycosyl hydrolase
MNRWLRMILGFNGVSESDLTAIDAAAPAALRLLDAEEKLQAIAAKEQPLEAHIDQMLPILKSRAADVSIILPVVRKMAAFVNSKS